MKILLDENLPKRLKKDFPEHVLYTVRDLGWNGKKNGELLKLLVENEFDLMLTFDKNIEYQQSLSKYTLTVFLLNAKSNSYPIIKQLVPAIKNKLSKQMPRGVTKIQ